MQHVEAARKLGQRHSHLVAAEAYLKLHGGDLAGAKETLKAVLEGDDAAQSPFLQGALGAVLLREGDLDAARDVLGKAQKASAGDVRIAWLLAEQFRRRGEGYESQAAAFYDYALRINKDHLGSILGKALVLLGRGQVEEAGQGARSSRSRRRPGASKPQQALAHAILGGVLAVAGQGRPRRRPRSRRRRSSIRRARTSRRSSGSASCAAATPRARSRRCSARSRSTRSASRSTPISSAPCSRRRAARSSRSRR